MDEKIESIKEKDFGQGTVAPLALYVHIPFCRTKCQYCDFLSFPTRKGEKAENNMERYVDALCMEISRLPRGGAALDSVFIGGGTPSILPVGCVSRIMAAIGERFRLTTDTEVSIESNPGTLDDPEKLLEYRRSGINRVSVGLQSLDDEVLQQSGRIHTAADFWRSYALLRGEGFDNINVDLIVGLPGSTPENMRSTLTALVEAKPEHISLYSLILEEESALFRKVLNGEVTLPDEDITLEMQRDGIRQLEDAGYQRYEISNFALEGRQCKHNLHIWRYGEYLAAGLGASSALFAEGACLHRYRNEVDLTRYCHNVNQGKEVRLLEERVYKNEQMFEFVMLGLRLRQGVSNTAFRRRFAMPLERAFRKAIEINKQKELILWDGEELRLSKKGFEWQNQVLLAFMDEQ